jgi:hypothetical protein
VQNVPFNPSPKQALPASSPRRWSLQNEAQQIALCTSQSLGAIQQAGQSGDSEARTIIKVSRVLTGRIAS